MSFFYVGNAMDVRQDFDRINRAAWNSADATSSLGRLDDWTDAGERAAIEWVRPHVAGEPILDIGIGAGRTVPLMKQISAQYVGVDYTEKLLDIARGKFPDTDLRLMDARDMSEFADETFSLAAFSFNGIDCVNYTDRVQILQEMYRVVKPGGFVVFSSHNQDGPGCGETIWRLMPRLSLNPIKMAWRTLRTLRVLPLASYNYLRNSRFNQRFDGYSVMNAAAHYFAIVIVYTTIAEQKRQLAEIGFDMQAVFGSLDGRRVQETEDTSDTWWFHFIARKPLRGDQALPA
jgi:ubiquinone/menaquinone biosynthesis C-methylase UbiE